MEPVIRSCPVCAKKYEAHPVRLSHGRETTCSRACSYQLRASGMSKRSEVICSVCGAKFERRPSGIKSKHEGIYCSRECHYAGRRLGLTGRVISRPYNLVAEYDRSAALLKAWRTRRACGKDRHSEATRERLRQATIRHISRKASGCHVSELENKVAQELARQRFIFERQFAVRDPSSGRYVAVADFYFPAIPAILEVNGTFWHADPRIYPDGPIFPSQKRTLVRYARKVEALKKLRIPLAEVWEADLDENFVDALRKSLRGLGI